MLAISGSRLIKLKSEFILPNPEPATINITYG